MRHIHGAAMRTASYETRILKVLSITRLAERSGVACDLLALLAGIAFVTLEKLAPRP
jgi:hypothetical protein